MVNKQAVVREEEQGPEKVRRLQDEPKQFEEIFKKTVIPVLKELHEDSNDYFVKAISDIDCKNFRYSFKVYYGKNQTKHLIFFFNRPAFDNFSHDKFLLTVSLHRDYFSDKVENTPYSVYDFDRGKFRTIIQKHIADCF